MLDKQTAALLKVIIDICDAEYKVLEKKEIFSQLKFKPSEERAKLQLDYLAKLNMITIKFQDDSEICLAPTPKAFAYFEDKKSAEADRLILTKGDMQKVIRACFFGALLGGAIIGAIVPLFWLIAKLIGG